MPASSPTPSSPNDTDTRIAIAHILFMDMVGYSRLHIDQQKTYVRELQQIVRTTQAFLRAEAEQKLIRRPTGDGMALVFLDDLLAPVQCAVEIGTALKPYPHLKMRMGLHSGPVYVTRDINGLADVHGDGIVMAQRVMDCGDANHIFVSETLAQMLKTVKPWSLYLEDIGQCPIKHGQYVHLFNFFSPREFGNPHRPKKIVAERAQSDTVLRLAREPEPRGALRALTFLLLFLLLAGSGVGTGLLASPTFRAWCGETFAFQKAQPSAPKLIPPAPDRPAETGSSVVVVTETSHSEQRATEIKARSGENGPVLMPDTSGHANSGDPIPPAVPDTLPNVEDYHDFIKDITVPHDGRGERIVSVIYEWQGNIQSTDSEPVGEGGTVTLHHQYKGDSLKIRIRFGDTEVWKGDVVVEGVEKEIVLPDRSETPQVGQ